MDISSNGAKMYLVIFILLICVIDSIKGLSRCRGYRRILLSICCVCIDYICSAGYVELPIVLLYDGVSTSMLGVSHAVQNEKKL